MSNRFWQFVCLGAVLSAFGCSQHKVEEPAQTVELTLLSGSAPAAGVPVKVVDEMSAANAVVLLAAREDLSNGIPDELYGDFFQALTPSGGTSVLTTDHDGKVVLKQLRVSRIVIAYEKQHLWVADATEARNRKLQLGAGNLGGQHGLDLIVARSAVLRALTTAALESVHHGKLDQARAIARSARSKALLTEIDWEETAALLSEAEHAIQQKNYDTANTLAARADALIPNQSRTKKLLERILVEGGGELHTLTGHKGAVTSVAYSADGKYVISGGEDRTLKLWDTASGKEVRTFTGHRGAVTSVAFSPDGNMVVSGSSDSTVRLWDVATGRELRATESLGWKISCVAFSPDGRFVASAGDDNQVRLWQLPKMEAARTLAGHGWRVTSVAFSPDGKFSLSGSEDDSMKLWDMAKGQEVRTLHNGLAKVTCVAFSPDGRFGLSGGRDKAVKLWNLANGREIQQFDGHTRPVRGVAFTRDGRFAVSASEDETVKVWELNTGKEIRTFTGHEAAVTGVAVSPDGHDVASAGADGSVRIWQLPRQVWPPVEEARK
jgi:WD40 repeat protein